MRSDICNFYGVVFCLTDMKNLTITSLILLISGGLSSEYLENLKIKRVVDGDTVHVFSKGEVLKVRLVEIDTPEMDQPHGKEAKEYLENLLKDGYINLDISGTDIYKRKLGRIYWKEKDINRLMVKSGHAWVYDKYVTCLLYTSPSPRDRTRSRMPSSA